MKDSKPIRRPGSPGGTGEGREERYAPPSRPMVRPGQRPPLKVFTTTLWEYPSQHYDMKPKPARTHVDSVGEAAAASEKRASQSIMQGDKEYAGATPSWVIWQCLQRYTREGDLVVDPMVGSGTTIDVCKDLDRRFLGYDLAPRRPDIFRADARKLPLEDAKADFVFVDPPYSTHIDYSNDPKCIGKLDAAGSDQGAAYYKAMGQVITEIHRVLKPKRYMALYVSDSWRKRAAGDPGSGTGVFMPIGFELFAKMRESFRPVDIISVVRHNQKLGKSNWHSAAKDGNFFLRGFNYLFIMKKE